MCNKYLKGENERMKKFLAQVLCAGIFVGLLMVPAGVSAEESTSKIYEKTVYLSDNFEREISGEASFSGPLKTGAVAAVTASIVNEAGRGNVLKVAGSNQRFTVLFANAQTAQSKVAVEFDFKMPENVTNSAGLSYLIALEADSGKPQAWWLVKDSGIIRAPGISSITDTNFGNKWYSVRVLYDVASGKTDWYAAESGAPLVYKGSYMNLNALGATINRFNIQGVSECYLDNLKAYEYVTDSELSDLIAQTEAALSISDEITPPVTAYSEESKNALQAAVATAKNELGSAKTADDIAGACQSLRTAYQTFLDGGQSELLNPIYEGKFSESGHLDSGYEKYGTIQPAVDPKGEKADVVSIAPNGGTYGRLIKNISSLTGSQFVLEASFMQEEKSPVTQVVCLFAGGNNDQHEAVKVYTDGTNLLLRYSDTPAGYTTGGKTGILVENYQANVWYDLRAVIDFETRTFMMVVNGAPVLTDRVLYLAGAESRTGGAGRVSVYAAASTAGLYLAGAGLYRDDSAALLSAFAQVKGSLAIGTGTEDARTLVKTAGGYDVSWSSEDFTIAQTETHGYSAFTTFPAGEENNTTGKLAASIMANGTVYSATYALPVSGAYRGGVINHSFDEQEYMGKTITAVDEKYFAAVGSLPEISKLDGREGGVLSLNNQRFLYPVPAEKYIADIAVVELDVMLPEKFDGNPNSMEHILMTSNAKGNAAGVNILTYNGNIALSVGDYVSEENFPGNGDNRTLIVPLVENYTAGKWYNIKAVHNFKTGTYKILIDGKPALDNMNIALATPMRRVERLSFYPGAGGTAYIDNIKVYSSNMAAMELKMPESVRLGASGTLELPIFPQSKSADGMIIADSYTYSLSGTDTTDIAVVRGGILKVGPYAKEGSYTVTATSRYDGTKTVSDSFTLVLADDYNVIDFTLSDSEGAPLSGSFGSDPVMAKAVLKKNREAQNGSVLLVLAEYDSNDMLVKSSVKTAEFTEIAVNGTGVLSAEITPTAEYAGLTVKAFLWSQNTQRPLTGSIYATSDVQ